MTKTCKLCKTTFETVWRGAKRIYCSKRCQWSAQYYKHYESRIQRARAYNSKPEVKIKIAESVARSKARYPLKDAARNKLNDAIKLGKLKRLPCEVCGNKQTQGHHPDYSRPLSVQWLCTKHHRELHRKYQLV